MISDIINSTQFSIKSVPEPDVCTTKKEETKQNTGVTLYLTGNVSENLI